MNNRVVHFEIPSDNPDKSMKFFTEVFGWKFQKFGNFDYWLILTGDPSTPGIDGGLMKKIDPKQPVTNHISVENLDEMIPKIEKAGGKIVVSKTAIPGVGYYAYFTDPDGNIHGVMQDDQKAG
ncbi:MAG TPA: VOC family protein [Cyclobacteriaceae bacterium]|nr:VOC family protein [Cyclobacteriaceae bacterium]